MLPLPFYLMRVLDLTTGEPGGYASRLLGDFGAEVYRVETPGRLYALREDEPLYSSINRNKFSVGIDVTKEGGHDLALRLAALCDVALIETATNSLSYEALAAARADVIVLVLPSNATEAPIVGLAGAGAALSAVFSRRSTGAGQFVEVDTRSLAANLHLDEVLLPRAGEAASGTRPSAAALADNVQLRERGFFETVAQGDGMTEVDGVVYRMERTPAHVRLPAPALGEHTDYVLREVLKVREGEIARLREAGAIAR